MKCMGTGQGGGQEGEREGGRQEGGWEGEREGGREERRDGEESVSYKILKSCEIVTL